MAAPTYRSSIVTSTFNGSTSFVVDMPPGAADGDLIAVLVYCPDGFYGSVADLSAPGGGWVPVAESLVGNAPIAGLYYLIASGAPSATYTWTKNDGSNATAIAVAVEAGTFDATNPFGSTPSSGTDYSLAHDGTAGTTVDVPTITPAVDECLGIALAAGVEAAYTWTPPSGFAERADSHDGTSYIGGSAATAALTTSATGALSFTANASVGSNKGVGALLALRTSGAPLPPAVDFVAVGTKTITGTTTVSIAHPAGTAADQVLLAGRVGWYSNITLADEATWTNTVSQSGGNNGAAIDNHTSTVRVDLKELTGADAGPTVFDQSGGTQPGIVGLMASYAKTAGTTWSFATSAGTDDTHGANRSVTGGTAIDLAVGDIVTAWVAVPTDVSLTITAPAITASGITFGTTTARAPVSVGSGQGHDGNIYMFDAEVTAGSGTVAPSFSMTTATSQSGPVAFVRLRSVAAAGDATATPAAIALAATLPAVTEAAGTTVSPAAIPLSAAMSASTTAAGGGRAPAAIALAAAMSAVTTAAGARPTPAVIPLTIVLPAPSTSADTSATATPGAIPLAVAMSAVTKQAGGTRAPGVITTAVALPAVTLTYGATTTPAVIPLAFVIGAVSASGGGSATATPGAIPLALALPAVTTQAGATRTPAAIVLAVNLPTVTTAAGARPTPGVIPLVVTIPAASATGGSTGTASPAVITTTVTLPAATPLAGSSVTPNPITLAVTMPAATRMGGGTRTPAVIPLTITMPAATASGSTASTATPNAIALVTVIPKPTNVHGYIVNPATIALAVSLAAVTASGTPTDATPATITIRDQYHTVTAQVVNHVTIRDADHTATVREQRL